MRVSSLAVDSPGEHQDLRSTRDLSHVQRRNWHCRMEHRSRHDKVLLISTRVRVPQPRAVSSSTPMEMMHLMGTMQPLAMVSASQGTYAGASITIGSATVMYMDPTTKAPVQATISGPINANVTFSSPITVGTTPMAMGFDLDLASSVTAGSGGNLSMNPVFHVSSGMQGSGDALDPTNGGIQQMMGTVSSVSGNSFVMTSLLVTSLLPPGEPPSLPGWQ